MSNTLLLLSHSLTNAQILELEQRAPNASLLRLPETLQLLFSQFPPGSVFPSSQAETLWKWISDNSCENDLVVLQGEFGLVYFLVQMCHKTGRVPMYATSTREASEHHLSDGSVELVHTFRHQGFREYPKIDG
jgi:DTW domain-containing protein YfiP